MPPGCFVRAAASFPGRLARRCGRSCAVCETRSPAVTGTGASVTVCSVGVKASGGASGSEKWNAGAEGTVKRARKDWDTGTEPARSKQAAAVIHTSRCPPGFDHQKGFLILGAAEEGLERANG